MALMQRTSVFCIAPTEARAREIVSSLKSSGFQDSDISVLLPDRSGSHQFGHELHTKAPEASVAGAGVGGVVGGTLGLLAGIGLLAVPGAGPLMAAGPIMAALSGLGVGATLGGITGALVGMGIPEIEARRCEGLVMDGNILIAAHSGNAEDIRRATAIFEHAGTADIDRGSEDQAANCELFPPEHDSSRNMVQI